MMPRPQLIGSSQRIGHPNKVLYYPSYKGAAKVQVTSVESPKKIHIYVVKLL